MGQWQMLTCEKPMTMNKWKILQFSDETLDDLDQHCPTEHSTVMEMLCTFTVQVHAALKYMQQHAALKYMKCGSVAKEQNLRFYLVLIYFKCKYKQPYGASGYYIGQCKSRPKGLAGFMW